MGLFGPPNVEKMEAKRDVQGLIKALDYQKDASVRDAAAKALGKLKDARAVVPLIAALEDESTGVRREAAEALGKSGDARAVEPLIVALRDKVTDVRRDAAEALGELKDARAVEPLVAALSDREVRWKAADALVKIGTLAVKPLIAALRYRGHEYAATVLKEIGTPAMEALIAALEDEDWHLRGAVAEALGKSGDARAVEPLIVALRDKEQYMRWNAAGALDKIGWQPGRDEAGAAYWIAKLNWEECVRIGAPAVEPLIAALKEGVRKNAAEALGELKDARAVEPLVAALNDRVMDVRWAAAGALDKIGWQPGKDEAGVAYWIAKQDWEECVRIGAPAVEPLVAALEDESTDVRNAAAEALGKSGDARAVEPLIVALRDEDKSVCRNAAEALGELKDARAVEPLIAALKYRDVREAAAGALDKIGWQPGKDEAGAAYWIAKQNREECVRIGAPAIEPLIAALKDEDWDVRWAAAEALVSLYRAGQLDETDKRVILAHRQEIARPHYDSMNDCLGLHTDYGGVEFPL